MENLEQRNKTPQNSPGIIFQGIAEDAAYGYSSENPILLGGIDGNLGLLKAEILLKKLAGPSGEALHFQHAGTCCSFETTDIFGGIRSGWLDTFEISIGGNPECRKVYFNLFQEDALFIPSGLTCLA